VVRLRFYEELNFFVHPSLRKQTIEQTCKKGTTVKALIELYGVPHTEVDLILVNGRSVPFSFQVQNNDRISVYPVFESFDISEISRVRSMPLRIIRFILDVHLGKLAKHLRLLGFDTLYSNSFEDEEIAVIAQKEKRIILTRDIGLLKRKIVTHGHYVKSRNPGEQIGEVIHRFDLLRTIKPFSRCIRCNTSLKKIKKEHIPEHVPEKIKKKYNNFYSCPGCQNIYWKGSHWKHMLKKIHYFEGVRKKVKK